MAYIAPTFLSRQGPTETGNFAQAAQVVSPGRVIGMWPCVAVGSGTTGMPGLTQAPRPIFFCQASRTQIGAPFAQQVPAPPMGRQVVQMLPAIYKRTSDLPLRGQRYPLSR